MINWIVIVVLVIIGIFAIKMNHLRHRFFILLLVFLGLFIYISMVYVAQKNNLNFSTTEGVFKSIEIYMGWLANMFHNLKSLTGSAVGMDWTSTNSSFFKK